MANVLVTGIPHVKMNKMVFLLKSTFEKNGISKNFWIQEFLNDNLTNMMKMNVFFDTEQAAYDAERFLDGFIFRLGGAKYTFSARMMDVRRRRSPSPFDRYRERSPVRHYDSGNRMFGHGRSRSRSPLHNRSDSNALDLEIELLRKRRLIIEEERRLLLERKKLDLVKEFGTNAANEFNYLEDRGRDRDFGRRPFERERRRSVDRFRRRSMERERFPRRQRSPPPIKPKPGLPLFVLPCRTLIASMKKLVSENTTTQKESDILIKLIRSTLRKRLAVALTGKPRLSTAAIVALYRKLYPETGDADFVQKLANNMKASYIPNLADTGAKEKGKKNNNEDTNVNIEEKETNEQKNNGEELDAVDDAENENNAEDDIETVGNADIVTEVIDGSDDVSETVENANVIYEDIQETNLENDPEIDEHEKEGWGEGDTDWNEVNQDAAKEDS